MSRSVQQSLPPMEVRKSESGTPVFRKSEHEHSAFRKPEDDGYATAAAIFDEALTGARITNKEVAHLLNVSESLVQKWRSNEARACPSFAQMLRLPFSFHWNLHKAMNRRYGFGRHALAQLLEAAGLLAVEQQP